MKRYQFYSGEYDKNGIMLEIQTEHMSTLKIGKLIDFLEDEFGCTLNYEEDEVFEKNP